MGKTRITMAAPLAALLLGMLSAAPAAADPVKCQQAIAKASSALVQDRSKILLKCEQAKIKGKLPAGTNCAAQSAEALAKAEAKLTSAIAKACGGKDKTCGTPDDDTLAAIGWPATCPSLRGGCAAPIAHCGDVAACLACLDRTAAADTNGLYHAALVPGTTANKTLNKCQQAIGGAGSKFLQAKSKALLACWDQRLKGKHAGLCPDPGASPKSPPGKAWLAIQKAEAKKVDAICKACGGASKGCGGGDDLSPSQIGFAPTCPGVQVPGGADCGSIGSVTSLDALVACVDCATEFAVDCVDRAAVPGLAAYPPECSSGAGPTPTPTPVPTATPTATPVLTPPCSQAVVTINTSYTPPGGGDRVSGVTTFVDYPENRLSIPGFGSEQLVINRVENLTGQTGTFTPVDTDSALNVGFVRTQTPGIPPGAFARATFDCLPAASLPAAAHFTCRAEIGTFFGNELTGTCTVSVSTTP
jgi:hypothetical protein